MESFFCAFLEVAQKASAEPDAISAALVALCTPAAQVSVPPETAVGSPRPPA